MEECVVVKPGHVEHREMAEGLTEVFISMPCALCVSDACDWIMPYVLCPVCVDGCDWIMIDRLYYITNT